VPTDLDARRSAPAALRNQAPIADVLRQWLPDSGIVLEVASGSGEHAVYFAERFPGLTWQPSDTEPAALASIAACRNKAKLGNLAAPLLIDAADDWPAIDVTAILCINMAHISPWGATLGLLRNAGRLLRTGGPLVLYGPWLAQDVPTAPSNLLFDADLRARNPEWGIRSVESLADAAEAEGFNLVERRAMPANNFMLLLRRVSAFR
jgi:SAM-dependent methyltransferase